MKDKSTAKPVTAHCETCKYCQTRYVAKIMDNTFKCRLMKYKTIDVPVLGGGSPAWCPINKAVTPDIKPSKHESDRLNALCDKDVHVKFVDGSFAGGTLHKDTLATFTQNPEYNNVDVIGYYIESPTRRVHFKKSHVKTIREARK